MIKDANKDNISGDFTLYGGDFLMEITDGIGYSQSEINLRFDHGFIVNKIMKFEANFQRDELAILLLERRMNYYLEISYPT